MKKRIEEIEQRTNAATPGPWKWQCEWKEDGYHSGAMGELKPNILWYGMDGEENIYCHEKINAEFIAHARTDIPYLISRVRALEKALSEAICKLDDSHEKLGLRLIKVLQGDD